ncbi:MAG: hypothetical protein M3Y81_04155 [Chloroflexota bacterium]|nr:hypothetical protein [Chloroflexota bacterium]
MADSIMYPTDHMSSTSRSLCSLLDEQWTQHTALFMNNADSYHALLQAVARVIPNAGGRVQELSSRVENYHQQYYNCYQALHALAEQIDAASQGMRTTDAESASGFEQMSL